MCSQVGRWLGCQSASDMAASPSVPMHVSHRDASWCRVCGCWSVSCFHVMFSFFFFDRKKRSDLLCIDNSFCATDTRCAQAIFLSLFVMHNDNQAAFQYAPLQIIISLQNCLSDVLLRILLCNKMCPLSINLPTLHPPPIRGRTHRKLLLASPVNQTASWKRDQFPSMHFLIITLFLPQTVIWICHALFVLPPNYFSHEWSEQLAHRWRGKRKGTKWICWNIKH